MPLTDAEAKALIAAGAGEMLARAAMLAAEMLERRPEPVAVEVQEPRRSRKITRVKVKA